MTDRRALDAVNRRHRFPPPGGLLEGVTLMLHFARKPTDEMRVKADRRKPWNERERKNG